MGNPSLLGAKPELLSSAVLGVEILCSWNNALSVEQKYFKRFKNLFEASDQAVKADLSASRWRIALGRRDVFCTPVSAGGSSQSRPLLPESSLRPFDTNGKSPLNCLASVNSCGAMCDLFRCHLCMWFNFCELTLHMDFSYQRIPNIFQPSA